MIGAFAISQVMLIIYLNFKKCIENDVAAMNTPYQFSIFNEPEIGQLNLQREEHSNFLFLEDIFEVSIYSPHQHNPFHEQDEPHFPTPFEDSFEPRESIHLEPLTETPNQSSKPVFKSSYTKNACYNICQKTIKVIKKGIFDEKLAQICQKNNFDLLEFKTQIVKKKKDFTGPKALSSYLEKQNKETKVFAEFMKYFLTEKYLRMAINEGEMKNLKVYIEFKNAFLLPLLE